MAFPTPRNTITIAEKVLTGQSYSEPIMNEIIINELRSKVFMDADVAIEMGKPPGNWIFQRLVDLVNLGLVSIVTTDVTMGQIVKHHVNDAYQTLAPLRQPRFRNVVSDVLGIELPHKRNADWRLALKTQYDNGVAGMFGQLKAEIVSLDSVTPSEVFHDYVNDSGFFTPSNKPDQFADAFVFAAVAQNSSHDDPMIIVARDKDFVEPVKRKPGTILLKSIEELFASYALHLKVPELPKISEFLRNALTEDNFFRQEVELEDFELDRDWILSAIINDVTIANISAFDLFHDNDLVFAMVDVKVELAVAYRYRSLDRARDDYHNAYCKTSGIAEIALFAAINLEIGVPVTLEEVKLREYVLRFDQPISNKTYLQVYRK